MVNFRLLLLELDDFGMDFLTLFYIDYNIFSLHCMNSDFISLEDILLSMTAS